MSSPREQIAQVLDGHPVLKQALERHAVYTCAVEQIRRLEPDNAMREQVEVYLLAATRRLLESAGVHETLIQSIMDSAMKMAVRDAT